VYRGASPHGTNAKQLKSRSLDGHLQELAVAKSAHVVQVRVNSVGW
jgi:hypothetical protein